jgi:hypothetical protein
MVVFNHTLDVNHVIRFLRNILDAFGDIIAYWLAYRPFLEMIITMAVPALSLMVLCAFPARFPCMVSRPRIDELQENRETMDDHEEHFAH